MSVAEAQSKISAREFSEWIAYGNIEPWGQERIELSIALAAANVCWAWGSSVKVEDIMPKYEAEEKGPMTGDEVAALFDAMVFEPMNRQRAVRND